MSNRYLNNQLLSTLPGDAIRRLDIESIKTAVGDELLGPGEPILHLYFPTTTVVCVVGSLADGGTSEIGVIGAEGGAGLVTLLQASTSPYSKMVHIGGEILRTSVKAGKKEFAMGGEFQLAVLSFVEKFVNQVAQTTLCNRWHDTGERALRWLLMHHDRAQGNTIPVTQELIAQMLGTTRVTIANALRRLQSLGYISYARGTVTIIDRNAMEANVCECYSSIQQAYARRVGQSLAI